MTQARPGATTETHTGPQLAAHIDKIPGRQGALTLRRCAGWCNVAMSNFLAPDGKRYFSYSQIAATVSGSVPEVQAFAPDVRCDRWRRLHTGADATDRGTKADPRHLSRAVRRRHKDGELLRDLQAVVRRGARHVWLAGPWPPSPHH